MHAKPKFISLKGRMIAFSLSTYDVRIETWSWTWNIIRFGSQRCVKWKSNCSFSFFLLLSFRSLLLRDDYTDHDHRIWRERDRNWTWGKKKLACIQSGKNIKINYKEEFNPCRPSSFITKIIHESSRTFTSFSSCVKISQRNSFLRTREKISWTKS